MTAIEWNRKQGYNTATIKRIQLAVGADADGIIGPRTVIAVSRWQAEQDLVADGMVGPQTLAAMKLDGLLAPQGPVPLPFDRTEQQAVAEFTVRFEAGIGDAARVYGAANTNDEYEGRWDKPRTDAQGNPIPWVERRHHQGFVPFWASRYHPSGGRMIGLSYGAWQGTQEGGTLGEIVALMGHRDWGLFVEVLGGGCPVVAASLTRLLTNDRQPVRAARNPRVQPLSPVMGEAPVDLWREPWLGRFREAAKYEVFRQCQRDVILSEYLAKVIKGIALPCGLRSQAALAVLFDISIQHGYGGLLERVRSAWGRDFESKRVSEGQVLEVVAELPARRQGRRRAIWRAADETRAFTEVSLRAFARRPPFSAALRRQLVQAAQR